MATEVDNEEAGSREFGPDRLLGIDGTTTSSSIDRLALALCKAQAEVKKAIKNSLNPHLRNKYADLESVLDVVRPAAAKHGLSFPCFPVTDQERGVAGVRWMLLHKSGQYMTGTTLHKAAPGRSTNAAQADGIAISYAKRYAVSSVFSVATGLTDTDGAGAGAKATEHPKAKPARPDMRKLSPKKWRGFLAALQDAGLELEAVNAHLQRNGKPKAHEVAEESWPKMVKWVFSDEGRKAFQKAKP